MKINSTLTVLLLVFSTSTSLGQNKNTKTEKSRQLEINSEKIEPSTSIRDSSRLKNYVKVKTSSKHIEEKEDHVLENQREITKVKSTVNQTSEKVVSRLNELSTAYWRTQAEIKKAKKAKDIERNEELELTSLMYRKKYISEYESIDESQTGVEDKKLYLIFKKDFIHE